MFNSVNDEENSALIQVLTQLIPEELQEQWLEWLNDSGKRGVPEGYVDTLPRVPKQKIKADDACAICCCVYLDDDYPLIIKLPHCGHMFDLQCISVWLSKSTTCPMCRNDVLSHKEKIDTSQAELEEDWGMFG
ncbi:HGR033Wp [Eremothecium sinecaudum]|uniref:HGR033Wp n=1 Tax=Eremothecium sinecaudum TaxID=45286 RepID=A0A0X8HVN5_9SACH|nr:HGR033Wp [Eremothecium sinecaudum]AMD22372.1 HGR033Wp [Eremothecium sinecaudum]